MNTAPGVCVLGWVKCREHFTAGYTLYNYVCKKKRYFFFTKPITDYGKMLKYRSISSKDISKIVHVTSGVQP